MFLEHRKACSVGGGAWEQGWLFSLACGECGEGVGVSMQRKTDRSRGKWNPEKHRLEASEKPSAPRGTRVSQMRISQDFGLPHH